VSATSLPASLQRFLATQIDTFDKLEIAVELASTGAEVERSHLAAGLSLPADVFARSLAELVQTGLLAVRGDAIGPANPEAARGMEELLRAYRTDGVTVVRAIAEIAMQRIRGNPARSFADAFVLRSKKKEDPNA